jgi:hypothetical protein
VEWEKKQAAEERATVKPAEKPKLCQRNHELRGRRNWCC